MGKKDCITKDCLFDEELEVCARCTNPFDHEIIYDHGFLKCTRCGGYEVDKTAELCKRCDATQLRICRVVSHVLGWGFVIGLAYYLLT